MLPAALGGFVSFAGVAVGATIVMPPVLQLIGRIGSRDPVVLLAGRNAMRAPGRSSRATIGLVIGVTLLVTFAVALGIAQHVLETQMRALSEGSATPAMIEAQRDFFVQLNAVVSVIVGFSAVIAAVGVVNALALGVLQRRRELGLLRVLGTHRGTGPPDDRHRGRADGRRGRRRGTRTRHALPAGSAGRRCSARSGRPWHRCCRR
ncbi:ABC transporter permease [Sphingomonas sp. LR61]|uniref:ABC transporter permease n=1 Tax=Sphingomonas sp. LR61 TaxID=3050234 RepID=UPI002FDFEFD0